MSKKGILTSSFYTKPLETEKKKSKAILLPEKKNTGSGTGYALGKLGLGLTNVFENVGKLVSGSLHQLFGDDRMAKYTFSSPTLSERADYNLTKSYNPNGVMSFVGDVASGLGQSSVFLLDAAGIPVGTTMFFGGAIGGSTSEAVRTTGELGMKEYIHGALTGANEGLLELATGKAGTKLLTAAAKGAKTTGLNLFAKEAVRKGLGRKMLESAGGEFIEEFLSEPMSVIWKRATGVDPDAEVNWMNAVYSGLVGFGSGGIMGGLTSSALNAYDYINGTKAKNNGREQVILNAAETIKDRFKTDKKYSTQMNDSITNLQAAYNTYNNAKNERAKTIALGDMWRNIATLEASAGVQNAYERITDTAEKAVFDASAKADAEEMAQTATRLFGKEITVDMLKNNTDNVSSDLAVHSWAVGFFANEDSRIKEIENKIAFESAPEYSEENNSLIDELSDGEHLIYAVGGKKAIIYKQANGYNLGFSEDGTDDIQMARNLSSEQVKLMLADAKEENLSKYKVAMAADRFYENYSGKSTEDTENEEKNVPTQETTMNDSEKTEKATTNPEKQENATERKKNASDEESRGDTNSNDNDDSGSDQEQAEREEASKTEKLKKKKERTTAELDRARKLIKNFDLLSYEKRESILRMLESHSSIPYYVAKFAAHHIANTGTHIMFSDTITSKGFRTVLKTKQGNEALIVVRPEKSSIGTTILHEIFHDIRDSKYAIELIDYVKKYPSFEDEKKKYADDYKKNLKRDLKDDELLTEEAAANIISERLDSDRFLQMWAKKDKNIIMRIYASLSQYAHRIKNKSKPVDLELRRLEKKYTAALRSVMSERKYKKFISDLEEWLDSRTKYMYAGENSRTADKLKLDTAKEMLDNGIDSETIRKETGWFKGYDGEWRFEISDFESSLIENPDLKKNTDDGEVYFTGKLSDIFDHKELFEAYPELKDINIIIQKTNFGVEGIYQPNSNYITLSIEQFKRYTKKYYDFLNGERKAEIAKIEESPEYKEMDRYYDDEVSESMDPEQWLKEEQIARDKFYSSEIGKRYYQLKWGEEPFVGEKFEFGWGKGAKEVLLHELQHAVQKIEGFTSGTNTNNKNYDVTAGEIEARDTANRANLTAEQRKNTQPDNDRTDVVFAENAKESFSIATNLKDTNGNSYGKAVYLDTSEFNGISPRNWWRILKRHLEQRIQTQGTAILPVNDENGESQILEFARLSDRVSKNGGESRSVLNELYRTSDNISKLSVIHIDEVVETSQPEIPYHTSSDKHQWLDANGWLHRSAYVVDSQKKVIYKIIFDIAKSVDGRHILYSTRGKIKRIGDADVSSLSIGKMNSRRTTDSIVSISQNPEKSTENQEKTEKTLYSPEKSSERKEKTPKTKEKPVHEQVKEIMKEGEREIPKEVMERLASEVIKNAPQYDEKGLWLASQLWIKEQNLDIALRKLEDFGRSLEIKNRAMKRKLTREFERKKEELDKKYKELLEDYVKAQRRADDAEVALKEAINAGIENDIQKLKGIYEERKDKAMHYLIEAEKQNINAQNISFLDVHFREAYDTVDKILGNYGIDIDEAENREKANELSNDVFYTFGKKGFTHDDSAALATKICEAFPALKENKAQIQSGITRRYNNLVKSRQKLAERYDPSGGLIAVYDAVEQLYGMLGNKKIMGSEILGDRDVKVFLEMIKKGFYRKRNAYGHVISVKPTQMREAMRLLKKFFDAYYKELFEGKHDEIWAGSFEIPEEIYTAVELLAAEGKDIEAGGDFSKEDLARLGKVIYAMLHLYKNFGLVWYKGNWTDAKPLAERGVNIVSRVSSMNDTFLNEEGKPERERAKYLFNNVRKYLVNAVTPDVAAQIMDGFDADGVMTELFREIRTGEIDFQNKKIDLLSPIDTFYKENKKFEQHLRKDRYTFRGVKLTAGDAISLYMTGKREQAERHLAISGFSYDRRSGNDGEIGGFINYSEANDPDKYKKARQDLDAALKNLEAQFSEEDKKFIKIAEKFFEEAKTLKAEADGRIFGYTNVIDGYYFPISVDKMSVALDVSDINSITKDFLRVYSLSFNKNTQKNAFKRLHITNVADVINHHANGVSLYSAMYLRMKSFGKIYNMNVSDAGTVISLRSTLKKLFKGADDYISSYLINSQGVTVTDKGVDKDINRHIGYIRKNLAPYAIGANVKSMLDQLTSYPIAAAVLSPEMLAKAFTRKDLRKGMEDYSEVARVRFYDSSYVGRSMGNIDKVNKVGQMTLAPMGFLDKKTIGTYWVACQLEIEKNEGLTLGSEENLKRAGELLDKVILETQAGGLSTEKSAYLRSKNELLKSLTMFTSTPTKQFSMLVSAIGTYNAYKDRVKNENATAKEKKAFEEAKAQLVRTATTLGVVIVIYVALSEVMKSFYDRDRKDKDGKEIGLVEDMLIELGGATLGAIPLYGQIYEFLTSGYGISNSTVDFINDFMTASSDMTGLLADAITGEVINKQRAYRTLKNSVDVIAQLTGIPVRNVENALKGVCRMISPNTVYKYDSLYYTPSYTKDLSEAINKGDEKLASTVLRLLYRNEKTGKLSTATAEEIVRLYDKYPSVIASTLSNKITVDGEEIELNGKQFRKFRDIYSKADTEVGKLIESDMYASLDDKGKARAIKTVYKAYFDKAKSSVLGTAETKVNSSTEFIPLEKLVLGSAYIDSLSGEGKKAQAVKWLESNGYTDTEIAFTLFANGYSSNDILKAVVSALNSSTKDKEDLILTFGIDDKCAVSNGKIKILQKNKNAA